MDGCRPASTSASPMRCCACRRAGIRRVRVAQRLGDGWAAGAHGAVLADVRGFEPAGGAPRRGADHELWRRGARQRAAHASAIARRGSPSSTRRTGRGASRRGGAAARSRRGAAPVAYFRSIRRSIRSTAGSIWACSMITSRARFRTGARRAAAVPAPPRRLRRAREPAVPRPRRGRLFSTLRIELTGARYAGILLEASHALTEDAGWLRARRRRGRAVPQALDSELAADATEAVGADAVFHTRRAAPQLRARRSPGYPSAM